VPEILVSHLAHTGLGIGAASLPLYFVTAPEPDWGIWPGHRETGRSAVSQGTNSALSGQANPRMKFDADFRTVSVRAAFDASVLT